MLSLEPLSRLLFYTSFIGLLFYPPLLLVALSCFGFRLLAQLFVIKKTMIRLNEKNLLVLSLLFDLVSMFINVGLYVSGRIRPANYQWK
jgi:hypothetical protein